LGGKVWVVKAQIHAGGRGKAGGVKVAKSLDEVKKYATDILHSTLVTHQTGPEGKKVNTLLIEEGCNIAKEFYLGIVLDRNTSKVTFMASKEGGVEIEEVAHKNPEAIVKVAVEPGAGYQPYIGRILSNALGLDATQAKEADAFYKGLYKLYVESDCSIAEINPLVLTADNQMIASRCEIKF
jgi:succinyl-CoA synthetase beta subunit